MLSKKF